MRKYWYLILGFVILAGCSPAVAIGEVEDALNEPVPNEPSQIESPTIPFENFGPAPELSNDVWLNTAQPLRLADLRGKVVLLDMWTFG